MAGLNRLWVPVILVVTLAFLVPFGDASAAEGSLEGRWKLIEQHYGKGKSNLADLEAPVVIEFYADLDGGGAMIWVGDDATSALAWPAYVTGHGPIPLEILDYQADPASGIAMSHYTVRPSPDDDLVLDIVEEYAVSEKDGLLEGTVTVIFTIDDDDHGSFILHRRFERMGR